MIINLLHLIQGRKDRIEINDQISNIVPKLNSSPCLVHGILTIEDGSLKVDLHTKIDVTLTCSRCIEEFVYSLDFQLEEIYDVKEEQGIIQDEMLDLTELLREAILMNIPMKPLCSTDCKGLCANCGTNLNVKVCNCHNEEIDPRLSVLKGLFDEDE